MDHRQRTDVGLTFTLLRVGERARLRRRFDRRLENRRQSRAGAGRNLNQIGIGLVQQPTLSNQHDSLALVTQTAEMSHQVFERVQRQLFATPCDQLREPPPKSVKVRWGLRAP